MTNSKPAELPVRLFRDDAAWEAWLAREHATSAGLWLRIAKAASKVKSVSYAEALDVALCYGWIDGQKKALDDATWLQKSGRRAASGASGRRSTARKYSGSSRTVACSRPASTPWTVRRRTVSGTPRTTRIGTASVPDDLRARARREHPKAKAFFTTLNSANRYAPSCSGSRR